MNVAPCSLPPSGALGDATSIRRWRLLTAARVFALATALGLTAATGRVAEVAATFLALCVLAAVMALPIPGVGWQLIGPVAEGALAALMLTASGAVDNPLLAYLLVPVLVAGIQAGVWWAFVVVATECVAQFAALLTTDQLDKLRSVLEHTAPWIVVGMGMGLLGAWMRASTRTAISEQQRYASAHRLLAQLHAVARDLPHGLDAPSIAQRTLSHSVDALGVTRAVLLLQDSKDDSLRELAIQGNQRFEGPPREDPVVDRCWDSGELQQSAWRQDGALVHRVALPLRVGPRMVGVVVFDTPAGPSKRDLRRVLARLDEQSLRLESAMLFERVRSMATVEERHRLAREIHDGIAQELASLGYLVDDLAATSQGADGTAAAQQLRGELTRIVNELRFSIFDLRMDVNQYGGLGQALSDYGRDIGARSGMTVHTALAETGQLPLDVQTELLRIAQEAIANVRKHAHAHNLWVTLNTNGSVAVLRVEDDGIGSAAPRNGHYGLQMMRERADRIGAELAITNRPRGGTSVVVALQPSNVTIPGAHRAHLSPTR